MASAAASALVSSASFLTISLLVLLLLRRYLPFRATPAYILVPIFLALALPASIILLVPIDLASSSRAEDERSKGIWLSERIVLVSWRISYWLTFILTWVLLPLLAEYTDAGYRDPKSRLVYSLRSNGRYQLMVLGLGVIGLVYISYSQGFNFDAIKGLVMALAYLWGLILAIYLMGHGLVAIPRGMFRKANLIGRLRRVQSRAPGVDDKLQDSILALEELEGQVWSLKQRKTGTAREHSDWIEDLSDMTQIPESRLVLSPTSRDAAVKVPAVITERYLADLTRKLERAQHQRARYVAEWDRIVQDASDYQAVLDSKASQKLDFGSHPGSSLFPRYSLLTPYLRYHLYVHVFPLLLILLGSFCTLASASIIWSELIKYPFPHLSAVSLTVIHRPSESKYRVGLGGQFLAAFWISYMSLCALTSLNDVPVWNQRALVRRHTSAESACWYAGQIAKLTVPLAYNFLTFLPQHIRESTSFYAFLGRLINLTPLGTTFDYLFPVFILLPVCATLFNLYAKAKSLLGFNIDLLDPDQDSDNTTDPALIASWRQGRDLIARDLAGSNPAGPSHSTSLGLGLADSPRPSIDHPTRPTPRAAPALYVPPQNPPNSTRSSSPSPSPTPTPTPHPTRRPRVPTQPDLDPESDEENIFALFGKRVKNTFEGIDTPKWMQGDASRVKQSGGFKKPRWMRGDEEEGTGKRTGLGRLFAGLGEGGSGSGSASGEGRGQLRL